MVMEEMSYDTMAIQVRRKRNKGQPELELESASSLSLNSISNNCESIPWFENVTTIKVEYGAIYMLECQRGAPPNSTEQRIVKMEPNPGLRGEYDSVNIGGFHLDLRFSASHVFSTFSPEEKEKHLHRIEDLKMYTIQVHAGKLKDPSSFKMGRKTSFRLIRKDEQGQKRELFINLPPTMNSIDNVIVHHDPNDPKRMVYIHILFPLEYFTQ